MKSLGISGYLPVLFIWQITFSRYVFVPEIKAPNPDYQNKCTQSIRRSNNNLYPNEIYCLLCVAFLSIDNDDSFQILLYHKQK
jgi:hypothetical protein